MNHNVDALEIDYRKCAEEYGAAYEKYDYKKTNRSHDKLVALLPKLRATPDRGAGILGRLMKNQSDAVAMWAATHSLPIADNDALVTLGEIAQRGGVFSLDAKMVIKEWKSGRLIID